MRLALAIGLAILVSRPDLATSKCARPSVGSVVLSEDGAKLAAGGGVLVGASSQWDGSLTGAENAVNSTWRFTNGTKEVTPVLVTLAPGLVAYQPPVGATGALTLVDGKTALAKVTATTDKPSTLGAPELTAVKVAKVAERYESFRLELDATFKTKPPEGAIAVVVLGVNKKKNVARSWARVTGELEQQVAGTSGRCDPGIEGEVMSKAGDKIVLAWVDENGRLGKPSKPITVTNAPPR